MTDRDERQLLVNATILNQLHLTGLGVYTVNVLNRLLTTAQADHTFNRIILLGSDRLLRERLTIPDMGDRLSIHDIGTVSPIRRLWHLNRIVRAAARQADTTFYSTTHHGVIVSGCRQVITIHDLFAKLFPQNYPAQSRYFNLYLPVVLRRSRHVITDSTNTANDLLRFYRRIPPATTLHAGLDGTLLSAPPEPIDSLSGADFILFVGPSYSYKNCERLMQAFASVTERRPDDLPLVLVFAGGRKAYVDHLKCVVTDRYPDLSERIRFTGFVSPGQLAWLYGNAAVLAITTLYEGFGLPALEGMHFGCPVIASDRGSLPEICADAALLVDPENADAIAAGIQRVLSDDDLRRKLVAAGSANLQRFDWQKTAHKVYHILCDRLQEKCSAD